MEHDESTELVFDGPPDVASTGLAALFRKDPCLESAVVDLLAHVREATGVMPGWNNYITQRTDSRDRNPTA